MKETNKYYTLPLADRLQTTAKTFRPYDCKIYSISSVADRRKKDQKMLKELIKIHGEVPYISDWRVWTVCGANGRKKNSKDYDFNTDHYFIYDHSDYGQREELRKLFTDGLILTLPTGQFRLVNMKKNGTLNMDQKKECAGCGREVISTMLARHEKTCKKLSKKNAKLNIHNLVFSNDFTSENFMRKYIEKAVTHYFDSQFKDFVRTEDVDVLFNKFINHINTEMNSVLTLKETNKNLLDDIENKTELIKNLSERLKVYEEKMNKFVELTEGFSL